MDEPVRKLKEFAENNKETQGKFTIGDEKVITLYCSVLHNKDRLSSVGAYDFHVLESLNADSAVWQRHNVFMRLKVSISFVHSIVYSRLQIKAYCTSSAGSPDYKGDWCFRTN